jgi:hypothetical protein
MVQSHLYTYNIRQTVVIKRTAMKLQTSTAVSLLLAGLFINGAAYSQILQSECDALVALSKLGPQG